MEWFEIVAGLYIVGYVMVLVWGWTHQHDPFWRGFCNPFAIRKGE